MFVVDGPELALGARLQAQKEYMETIVAAKAVLLHNDPLLLLGEVRYRCLTAVEALRSIWMSQLVAAIDLFAAAQKDSL
jgi:hypothetical protein